MSDISNASTMVNKESIFFLFGCYCNKPELVLNSDTATTIKDYPEMFHRIVWGTIHNIATKGNVDNISPFEIELELKLFNTSFKVWEENNGWEYIESAIELTKDKVNNAKSYRDSVRKYSILRSAQDMLQINTSFIYDENDDEKLSEFNKMTSAEVLQNIETKFDSYLIEWNNSDQSNYSFHVGDEIESRLEEYKNQDNTYGYPYQSKYMNTAFKGMKQGRYFIRSSISGGGKSRNSMADACNIACDKIYDWNINEWVSTGVSQPVLFISTELSKEEIQDCLLAHISGIDTDKLESWDLTDFEKEILIQSTEILKESKLYGEYQSSFTIDTISSISRHYIVNKEVKYVFFDYINDTPELYSSYVEKTKTKLQTHQILYMFSKELKDIANDYNVYLSTSTQMNNQKDNEGSGRLKGSTAIIEKADYGVIALPPTPDELRKVDYIINNLDRAGQPKPNMMYRIYKNRHSRYKDIIIWTNLDLGTVRETDCFVTDNNFNIIDMPPTDIQLT